MCCSINLKYSKVIYKHMLSYDRFDYGTKIIDSERYNGRINVMQEDPDVKVEIL